MNTTDEALGTLLADIENWKKNLPSSLQFRGPNTPLDAGPYHCVPCWAFSEHWLCRSALPVVLLRFNDLLARLYADLIHVPGTPQVFPHH
jgi:hypothetical protein